MRSVAPEPPGTGDIFDCHRGCLSEISLSHTHCIAVLVSLLELGIADSRWQWRAVSLGGVTSNEGQALIAGKDEASVGKKTHLKLL